MKVLRVETIPVQVPLRSQMAIRASKGTHAVSPFLLIKVHTDEGLIGLGEVSCTPRWSGEDQVTAKHFIDSVLAPQLAGEDPREAERLSRKLRGTLAGNPFTHAGVEMALWDILGKTAGLPLYQLLGGARRDSIATKWSVSGVEPGKAADIARWAVEQGFQTLKVKVGISPEEDIARVRAVRQAVGPAVRIGVDANGGWSPAAAVKMIRRLSEFDIYFVEQPVPPSNAEWMADVHHQTNLPLIADESVWTAEDALTLARLRAADVFSIYIGKSGGIGAARSIAAVSEAAGIVCTVGSNLELGVGSAAMIHLAIATAGIAATEFPCDIIGPLYYEEEILAEPLPIRAGRASPPSGSGLGIELDEKKVERYRLG